MQYRDGLSVLGFGCMRFPRRRGEIDRAAAELLILQAIESGVNYFDTAYLYLGSEALLGEVLERDGLREIVNIATKLPHGKVRTTFDLDKYFETSLARLRTDHVDFYLIHNVASCDQWLRLVDLGIEEWIARKKAAGAIARIGFSFHGASPEFMRMLDAYNWDFVQVQYNYVNENYQAGRSGLLAAAQRGLPVVVMEPLLGGRLADALPAEASRILAAADDEIGRVSLGNAGWALRWLWDQPEVTVVLSGMNAPAQVAENCAIAEATLPGSMIRAEHEAISRARELFGESFRVPCTGCNYCLPCPQGVSIPSLFAAYNESYSVNRFTGMFHYLTSAGATDPAAARLASDCVQCGACSRKCPQHIDIPTELARVRRRLEPPGTRLALALYSRIP